LHLLGLLHETLHAARQAGESFCHHSYSSGGLFANFYILDGASRKHLLQTLDLRMVRNALTALFLLELLFTQLLLEQAPRRSRTGSSLEREHPRAAARKRFQGFEELLFGRFLVQ